MIQPQSKSTRLSTLIDNPHNNPSAVSWIQVAVGRIAENFFPEKIILFGSYARGEATQHSDIDLLVVLSEVANKHEKAVEIRRILSNFPVSKDIVITTPQEIDEYGQMVGRVLQPALREGKVLYEREK